MKAEVNQREPYPTVPTLHRERLGEWAAVLCIALLVFLSLCWPSVPPPVKGHAGTLPEPSASYVKVIFTNGFPDVLPHHGAKRIDGPGGTFSLLPRPQTPPLPPIPHNTPRKTFPPPPPRWTAPVGAAVSLPIEGPAPLFPRYGDCETTNPLSVHLGSALQSADYRFTPPAGDAPIRLACTIDIGADGRVRTLLLDGPEASTNDWPAWRQALLTGRARTNAIGRIRIERLPGRP